MLKMELSQKTLWAEKNMTKIRNIILIFVLFLSLSTTGVYGIWRYAAGVQSVEDEITAMMGAWDPDVILPDNVDGLSGTDHNTMIEEILNNSHSGLNPKPKVLLGAMTDSKKNPYAKKGLFYSELEKVTGGNLKFLFEKNIVNIDFLMETVVSERQYYVYTYLAPTSDDLNTVIQTYKTLIEKVNGVWVASHSTEGAAPVISLTASDGSPFYAVDHLLWENR